MIDILDDVIRTPDEFLEVPDNYRSAGGLSEPPGGTNGPSWALVETEEGYKGLDAPPPLQSELD